MVIFLLKTDAGQTGSVFVVVNAGQVVGGDEGMRLLVYGGAEKGSIVRWTGLFW